MKINLNSFFSIKYLVVLACFLSFQFQAQTNENVIITDAIDISALQEGYQKSNIP
ncbi:hypothetical protein H9X57_11230 [Flavobacterium piscinae]|uniref:hypothetical protein n=1 Tax=Flavobacterium piscinae TaxID=2506424 RepID=UPI0019A0B944|nr:hypothetical protein [Flavobacterium piscinae]MBC8883722.1 hypothetical protein [Flavobacterium piscinae]